MDNNENIDLIPVEDVLTFWDILTPDERNFIKNTLSVQHFKKNEVIQREGDKPTHLMILASGNVKVSKMGTNNRIQIVRILKPGEHFGFRAIIANEPNSTTVTSFEESMVYSICAEHFISILKNNNAFCYRFLEELAFDLAKSDARTVNLTQKHIRGRLAGALCALIENYGLEEDGATISIYLAREDLANLSNMTTSNAIRTLAIFANEGIIALDGRKIKIIDMEKLQRTSKYG
ncbi:MAG: Crp/Fnr family transcriptional regulator [Bacteroidales bacterium]|nr:Crp/Fnr family transcriptional regulator [Bacteroidales bacterium]